MNYETIIEIVGALIGIIYLLLEYKASIYLWPISILMAIFYIFIFFNGKLYASMCTYIYFLCAGIYGWICWFKSKATDSGKVKLMKLPRRYWSSILPIMFVLTISIYVILLLTDHPAPLGDAIITAMSAIALWLLAHRYIEQWIVWVIVDAISTLIYFSQALYPTTILFSIYTVVSVFGFFKWKKLIQESYGN